MILSRRWARGALGALVLAVSTACYSYHPVENPSPGTTVRVRVPLTSAVSTRNQAPETLDVEGVILRAPTDSLILETESRRELGTFKVLTSTDTVGVARANLVGLEERSFSSAKTYGLTALVVAGAVGLVLAAIEAGGGQDGDGSGGGPITSPGLRVDPVFSFLWKLAGG